MKRIKQVETLVKNGQCYLEFGYDNEEDLLVGFDLIRMGKEEEDEYRKGTNSNGRKNSASRR